MILKPVSYFFYCYEYINQNYHKYIDDHIFINSENLDYLKKGMLIKAIDKKNLQLKLNGKILGYDKDYNFIKSLFIDKYF